MALEGNDWLQPICRGCWYDRWNCICTDTGMNTKSTTNDPPKPTRSEQIAVLIRSFVVALEALPTHPGLAGDFDDKVWIDREDLRLVIEQFNQLSIEILRSRLS